MESGLCLREETLQESFSKSSESVIYTFKLTRKHYITGNLKLLKALIYGQNAVIWHCDTP